MSLNPSNAIAARTNPNKTMFRNLATHDKDEETYKRIDEACLAELKLAGIGVIDGNGMPAGPYDFLRENREVPFGYIGCHCRWSFRRAWYYWVAEGPGIPAFVAQEFHQVYGTQVRVNGHCGCPSPVEQNNGFGTGVYHIDTQEGLTAFARLLEKIYIKDTKEFTDLYARLYAKDTATTMSPENWDVHEHKDELRVNMDMVYHPIRGILCWREAALGCHVYHPYRFTDGKEAAKWIREGTIANLQESICCLDVGFSTRTVEPRE